VQLQGATANTVGQGIRNTNVDADVMGAELEARWRPAMLPRAELELGVSWLDTEVKSAPQLFGPDPTGGDPALIMLKDWTIFSLSYVAPAASVLPLVDQALAEGVAIGEDEAPGTVYPNGVPSIFSRQFLEDNGVATGNSVTVDVEGNEMPQAPQFSVHFAASYLWSLTPGELTARWDYYWQDEFYTTIFNGPADRVDSWDQHNASLTFDSAGRNWTLKAWVRNIEDETHVASQLGGFRVTEPRLYGVTLRYSFGSR
jgi:outer membrane receptor protein involved in Fe transport